MDSKTALPNVPSDVEFNTIGFEKKLSVLKDSQDGINSLCQWCLQNRQHHKKIVSSWLNVLKRVKLEQRVTLFYLANDVIQYSKRRNYDFVESWGTTLQKATTMVRDEKVKRKILRIFKIWEERGIYGEEFITDLSGLISASPSARRGDETHEFQSSYLIQKIRSCSKLENDTDTKLNELREHNRKIQIDSDSLISSLKDRAHVDDVEKELDDYTKHTESYINALKVEIKARIHLISLLSQAESQLENDKKDVKLVTTAYRTFSTRVKTLKRKLDEKLPTLSSPIPSPDINAPSPSSDSEIELPNITTATPTVMVTTLAVTTAVVTTAVVTPATTPVPVSTPVSTDILFGNAGYYNPVPPPDLSVSFNQNNNFSSFMGSNMAFSLANLNSPLFGTTYNNASTAQTTTSYSINNAISSLFPSLSCPPPPPAVEAPETPPAVNYYNSTHAPLLPPPMPPFSKSDDHYGPTTYTDSYNSNNSVYTYDSINTSTSYSEPVPDQPSPPTTFDSYSTNYTDPYQNPEPPLSDYSSLPPENPCPPVEDYNPAEEVDTWETESNWEPPPIIQDTPESPPMSEKTSYVDPVEYREDSGFMGASNVEHELLPSLVKEPILKDPIILHHSKDVDHRNLISLTASPVESHAWSNKHDEDLRKAVTQPKIIGDQDYRVPFIESLKLPPPPPPPKALTSDSDVQFVSNYTSTNTSNSNMNSHPYSSATAGSNALGADSNKYNMCGTSEVNSFASNQNVFSREYTPQSQNKNKLETQSKKSGLSPKKTLDNVESIDMDLSDDNENEQYFSTRDVSLDDYFEPPPDLLDDLDANTFLDDVQDSLDLEDLVVEDLDNTSPANEITQVVTKVSTPVFSIPTPLFNKIPLGLSVQEPPPNWTNKNYIKDFAAGKVFGDVRPDFPHFRGRGPFLRGNFVNVGIRGNWIHNNRGGGIQRGARGGMIFRGFAPRGPRGRIFRGRGRGDGNRGRGDFRGRADFRNLRGGF
ncbi:hypothetical protein FQA39_LY04701 [Lamprigera yunnana]|nr:hypothetical protein FQA39_LY04701 [Lamprigera yunnana]